MLVDLREESSEVEDSSEYIEDAVRRLPYSKYLEYTMAGVHI